MDPGSLKLPVRAQITSSLNNCTKRFSFGPVPKHVDDIACFLALGLGVAFRSKRRMVIIFLSLDLFPCEFPLSKKPCPRFGSCSLVLPRVNNAWAFRSTSQPLHPLSCLVTQASFLSTKECLRGKSEFLILVCLIEGAQKPATTWPGAARSSIAMRFLGQSKSRTDSAALCQAAAVQSTSVSAKPALA